jgi:D-methionine transport system substrate-binding protein
MKKLLWIISVCLFAALMFIYFGRGKSHKLRIGASSVPHAEILNFIKSDLKDAGIDLEIIEFSDYITPNTALNEKQIDANFFQHLPYLNNFAKEHGMDLVSLIAVHIEPQGFYSKKIDNIDRLKAGAVIAIPNDPTNEGRALILLETNGIIKLKADAGLECTLHDIVGNPKNLNFKELESAQIPRVLDDVDGAVINGHCAIESKLNPLEDSLFLENENSPYANIIAVRRETKDDPRFKKLVEILKNDKVREHILKTYRGGVIPVSSKW